MSTVHETTDPFDLAREAAQVIASRSGVARHDLALVLGSGWGGAADLIGETVSEIPAAEVPGFHAPAVAGHVPVMRSIRVTGTDRYALVLGSRTHFYEGRGVRAVAHGMRTAAAAGARQVVLTNGCGGLNPDWRPGQVVLIHDHINLTAASPLEGATFVDLTDLYSQRLRDLAHEVDPSLPEGVYVQFRGPHYETPAEVKMAGILGGDLVGMSTTLEAIAAREAGMEVMGLSLMTNLAAVVQTQRWRQAPAAGSALGVLRSAAGLVQTGLLALDDTSVAGEESGLLQRGTVGLTVDLVEGAGDAQAQSAGLAGDATTVDAGDDVEAALEVEDGEGGTHELLVQLVGEVVLQGAAVQRPLAGARNEAHAGDGLLAATQASTGSGDGLATALNGALGLGGVAGGGVLLVQRVNVDSGLSHDMSFACRGVPSAGALTGRPG